MGAARAIDLLHEWFFISSVACHEPVVTTGHSAVFHCASLDVHWQSEATLHREMENAFLDLSTFLI